MYIRRVLISQIGIQGEAFYHGDVIPYHRPGRYEPVSTAHMAENGHGKTTLIAFLLSVFEPNRKNFVQKLQRSTQEMDQYLRGGVPGVVAIELARSLDGTDKTTHVVGCCYGFRSSSTELRRIFFSFETRDDLDLESVPWPKSPSDSQVTPRRWEDVLAWAQERQAADVDNPALGFRYTVAQNDWADILASRNIPRDLIAHQVKFASEEGGIDKLLTFDKNRTFAQTLFGLVGVTDEVQIHLPSIRDAAASVRERPAAQRRLAALEPLATKLDDLASAAENQEAAKAVFNEAQKEQRGFFAGLASSRREAATDLAAVVDTLRTTDEQISQVSKEEQEVALLGAALKLGRDIIELKSAEADFNAAISVAEAAQDHETALDAARDSFTITALRAKLNGLQKAREAAVGSVNPLVKKTAVAAIDLRQLLEASERGAEARVVEARARIQKIAGDLVALAAEKERHGAQIKDVDRQRRESEKASEERRKIVESLGDALRPPAGVSLADHETNLREVYETLMSAVEDLEERQNSADETLKEMSEDASEKGRAVDKAENAAENARRVALVRKRLGEDIRVASADLLGEDYEPFNEAARMALKQAIEDWMSRLQTAERDVHELEELVSRLNQGLAFSPPGVIATIKRLRSGGINAIAATEWVRERCGDDAEKARAMIAADPARFAGVMVDTPRDLSRVERIFDRESFKLAAPVVVTTQQEEASSFSPEGRIVLDARDDAAYSGPTQQERLEKAEDNLRVAGILLAALQERKASVLALGSSLNRLSEDEAVKSIVVIEAELEAREEDLTQATAAFAEATTSVDAARSALKVAQDAAGDARKAAETARRDADRVRLAASEARGYESRILDTGALHALRATETEARDQIAKCVRTETTLEGERREQTNRADVSKQNATDFRAERGAIPLNSGTDAEPLPVAPSDEQLNHARESYKSLAGALEDKLTGVQREYELDIAKVGKDLQNLEDGRKRKLDHRPKASAMPVVELGSLEAYDSELVLARVAVNDAATAKGKAEGNHEKAMEALEERRSNMPQQFTRERLEAEAARIAEGSPDELTAEEVLQMRRADDISKRKSTLTSTKGELERRAGALEERITYVDNEFTALDEAEVTRIKEADAPPLPDGVDAWRKAHPAFRKKVEIARTGLTAADQKVRDVTASVRKAVAGVLEACLEGETADDAMIRDAMGRIRDVEGRAGGARNDANAARNLCAAMRSRIESTDSKRGHALAKVQHSMNTMLARLESCLAARIETPGFDRAPILTLEPGPKAMRQRTRGAAERYFDELTSAAHPPKDAETAAGAMFSTLVRATDRSEPVFKILKLMTQSKQAAYHKVEEVKASGGQILTAAMLLYMLTVHVVRANSSVDLVRDEGVFLILDNPFSKANAAKLIRAQLDLATQFKLQLIVSSGLRDPDTMEQFPHMLTSRAQANGRVIIAHQSTPRGLEADIADAA